jgi:hypothetical protein
MLASRPVTTTTNTAIPKAIAAGALAFGATGILAPKVLLGVYGLPTTPPVKFLARLWGTRTAALGALYLASTSEDSRRRMLLAEVALNAADAAVAVTAAGIPVRARVMAALTSAGFAGAGAAVIAGAIG